MNHYPVLDKLQHEIELELVNIETMPVGIADGQEVSKYKLDAMPVWDGMALANGHLYLAAKTGEIVGFKGM